MWSKMNYNKKAFTIIEVLTVVTILAIIASILLWMHKGSYQHSRQVLIKEHVQTLNKYVELYQLHFFESNAGKKLLWKNKTEAIAALMQKIPNTDIIILQKKPHSENILDLILWNSEKFQFQEDNKR